MVWRRRAVAFRFIASNRLIESYDRNESRTQCQSCVVLVDLEALVLISLEVRNAPRHGFAPRKLAS